MKEENLKIVNLELNDILPNRFQPRIKFNEESIVELSASIKEHGLIQPIIVRPISDKYEIIAGERRYKACVLADLETIPAIVLDLNDKDSIEVALIENLQRKDLTPIEEAISYKKTLDMGLMTQEQLASKLGRSQSTIANKIRLLNLCDEVQEALMEEKISERHARSLLKIDDNSIQKKLLYRIIKERITVRKLDEIIENKQYEADTEENIEEEVTSTETTDKIEVEKESTIENVEEKESATEEKDSEEINSVEENNEESIVEEIEEEPKNKIDLSELAKIEKEEKNEDSKITEIKEEKEKDDNMNNMQNMNGDFNFNAPSQSNTTAGRFFGNKLEEKEEKNENSGFVTGNEPVQERKTPDIFSGNISNLMAPQGSNPSFQTNNSINQNAIFTNNQSTQSTPSSNINPNPTSIFGNVSFHNDVPNNNVELNNKPVNNVFNEPKVEEFNEPINNTVPVQPASENTSMFSNLMNNQNQSDDIVDKQTLNNFLDPTFIDGEKQNDINSSNPIDEMVFAKFIDNDNNENNNNVENSNSFVPNNNLNETTVETENTNVNDNKMVDLMTPMNSNVGLDLSNNEAKPDLLAPMSSNDVVDSTPKTNNLDNLLNPINVNPFMNNLEPDTSIMEDKKEEETDNSVLPEVNNSSIFITASNNSDNISAPSTPIIEDTNISKLLTPAPVVDNTPEEVAIPQNNTANNIVEEKEVKEENNDTIGANMGIEPIIITDYNKLYDPIIPDSKPVAAKPQFKDILNLIRNLSDTIEKMGYNIDTEEIDLENNYQITFNIEK